MQIWGVEFDMGDNLSVRFPHGETPIIKVGTDEVIFKVSSIVFICEHTLKITSSVRVRVYADVLNEQIIVVNWWCCQIVEEDRGEREYENCVSYN